MCPSPAGLQGVLLPFELEQGRLFASFFDILKRITVYLFNCILRYYFKPFKAAIKQIDSQTIKL